MPSFCKQVFLQKCVRFCKWPAFCIVSDYSRKSCDDIMEVYIFKQILTFCKCQNKMEMGFVFGVENVHFLANDSQGALFA